MGVTIAALDDGDEALEKANLVSDSTEGDIVRRGTACTQRQLLSHIEIKSSTGLLACEWAFGGLQIVCMESLWQAGGLLKAPLSRS